MAWVDGMDEHDQLRWLVKENERLRAALVDIAAPLIRPFRSRAIARAALAIQPISSDEPTGGA